MGPTIILDKSTLQSLSKRELVALHKFYTVNITPILPLEIMADLTKPAGSSALSEKDVIDLSNKLILKDIGFNGPSEDIAINSLLGFDYSNTRRPAVIAGPPVRRTDGRLEVKILESQQEIMLRKWQKGQFNSEDYKNAGLWRKTMTELDTHKIRELGRHFNQLFPQCDNFNKLLNAAKIYLDKNMSQSNLIYDHLKEKQIPQEISTKICYRWETIEPKEVKTFAPYFYYVQLIHTYFFIGVALGLINERLSNQVDMLYLHYLPFCEVFSSRDNLHKKAAPPLLSDDQTFIEGDELKKDLKLLADHFEKKFGDEWISNMHLELSDVQDSIAFKLLQKSKKYAGIRGINNKFPLPGFQSLDDSEYFTEDEIDVMTIESSIGPEDQCFCGSGKQLKDCCIDKLSG